jgi:5-methylcytosine-specific restriction endonuclease McrA
MSITWELPVDRKYLTRKQVAELFLRQQGRCIACTGRLETKGNVPVDVIREHMQPLFLGGDNDLQNMALLCKPCATVKTAKEATQRGKMLRQRDAHIGAKRPSRNPMRGSKASGWKCRLTADGPKWERR